MTSTIPMDNFMHGLAEEEYLVIDNTAAETILAYAGMSHARGISQLYKLVHVSENRLSGKLDVNNPDSYLKTGGIFKILDEKTLKEMIGSDDYHVLVAISGNDGLVVAYGSYHLKGEDRFDRMEINDNYSQLTSKEYSCFLKSLETGRAAYGVDWITMPAWRRQRLCSRLQDLAYSRLLGLGYTHVFYEIFTIVKGDSEHPNPNDSLSVTKFNSKRAGCVFKHLSVGNRTILVRSDFHVRPL